MNSGPASVLPASSLVQLTGSLALVVGLIFALTWVVRRFHLATPRRSRAMSVMDELALGPRERIVLVQVGNSQVLLVVGVNGLTALTPLPTPVELPPAPANGGFADRLRDLMHRPGAAP